MTQAFALVDCNNFFVSCERVFRPDLWDKPVVVLSNNDGCVISRSNEAKALGIRMAQPFFEIKRLVQREGVEAFSCNFQMYGDMSTRVMGHLHSFTPDVEVYSIDEAFLHLDSQSNLLATGQEIRQKVLKCQGIPTAIGIAPTKTLAKVAAELAKNSPKANGVVNLVDSPHVETALKRTPVRDVWGVGWKIAKTLEKRGIRTAYDLTQANDEWLKKTFSVVFLRTVMELRGISCLELDNIHEPRKSVMVSRSVDPLVEDLTTLKELIAGYASRAAEKLREDDMEANGLMVFIRTAKYREEPQYYGSDYADLTVAASTAPELIQTAHRLLERIYKPGYRYYKAGVMAVNLTPKDEHQNTLFQPFKQDDTLSPVVDTLNQQYGDGTIRYLAEGFNGRFRVKRSNPSPRYTTHFDELCSVS